MVFLIRITLLRKWVQKAASVAFTAIITFKAIYCASFIIFITSATMAANPEAFPESLDLDVLN